MAIVGPGAVQQDQISPDASLDGASEYEYVTLLNPLTDDFAIQVAQTRPVDLPFNIKKDPRVGGVTHSEGDVAQVYGVGLRNPDHKGQRHILNTTVIPSGKTINLRGDVAQVAIRQLIAEIMQREGKKLHIADPVQRKIVEDRIIIARGSIEDLMDNKLRPVQSIINETIEQSNEVKDEEAFPDITVGQPETGNTTPGSDKDDASKASGNPKKTN